MDESTVSRRGDVKEPIKGASVFGLWVFIAALSMLFAASLAGYVVIRLRAPEWPPPGAAPIPFGLYFSTLILIGSSLTLHGALDSARKNRQALLRWMLGGTLALGIAFLISQAIAWSTMLGAQAGHEPNLYSFTFFVLTMLHGAHVLGGLIPLAITTYKGSRGMYNADWHLPLRLMSMYWHFLLVVWLVMFLVMVAAV
ncbi:heme-copper oxidase subunit III [bacterium]|nr:heme-copper oxidase subunit III [bacterium]